ncbi:hypothetical protein [Plantactinospora sp. DSM 117369]
MSDISADPDHLRGVAARLAELAGRVDVLSRGLSDGGAVPDRSQFPELPVGEQAATVWRVLARYRQEARPPPDLAQIWHVEEFDTLRQ